MKKTIKSYLIKLKQVLCRHNIVIRYSSHYPFVACDKCKKVFTEPTDELTKFTKKYVDKK